MIQIFYYMKEKIIRPILRNVVFFFLMQPLFFFLVSRSWQILQ